MIRMVLIFLVVAGFMTKASGATHRERVMHTRRDTLAATDSMRHAIFPEAFSRGRCAENKKLVAAILAFPVPFGVLGLHRIYLGTEPWVPIVYICTLGGVGVLALADFIAIVSADAEELSVYEHNPKVFMWVGTKYE